MKRFACGALVAFGLGVSGCGSVVRDALVHDYMGVAFRSPQTDPVLADTARRALAGDKAAQLALGIAFEEGRGVPVDRAKARTLYRLAASESGGPVTIYAPGVAGHPARLSRVTVTPRTPGLPEARARLEMLDD